MQIIWTCTACGVMNLCKDTPPLQPDAPHPEGVDSLVLFVSVKVKDIARLGRAFPWKKPRCCPRCHTGLWWHGFVLAYFACCAEAVHLAAFAASPVAALFVFVPVVVQLPSLIPFDSQFFCTQSC